METGSQITSQKYLSSISPLLSLSLLPSEQIHLHHIYVGASLEREAVGAAVDRPKIRVQGGALTVPLRSQICIFITTAPFWSCFRILSILLTLPPSLPTGLPF